MISLKYVSVPADPHIPVSEGNVRLESLKVPCETTSCVQTLCRDIPNFGTPELGVTQILPFPSSTESSKPNIPLIFFKRSTTILAENKRAKKLLDVFGHKLTKRRNTFYGDVVIFWRKTFDESRQCVRLSDFSVGDWKRLMGLTPTQPKSGRISDSSDQEEPEGHNKRSDYHTRNVMSWTRGLQPEPPGAAMPQTKTIASNPAHQANAASSAATSCRVPATSPEDEDLADDDPATFSRVTEALKNFLKFFDGVTNELPQFREGLKTIEALAAGCEERRNLRRENAILDQEAERIRTKLETTQLSLQRMTDEVRKGQNEIFTLRKANDEMAATIRNLQGKLNYRQASPPATPNFLSRPASPDVKSLAPPPPPPTNTSLTAPTQFVVLQPYTMGGGEAGTHFADCKQAGEKVTVERQDESGWWWVVGETTRGWYPSSFLKPLCYENDDV